MATLRKEKMPSDYAKEALLPGMKGLSDKELAKNLSNYERMASSYAKDYRSGDRSSTTSRRAGVYGAIAKAYRVEQGKREIAKKPSFIERAKKYSAEAIQKARERIQK